MMKQTLSPRLKTSAFFLLSIVAAAGFPIACTFDTSGLPNRETPAICGNGVKEAGETCDGEDLGGQTCITQGFDGGTLACSSDCQSFSTTNCTGTGPSCGNGVKEAGETCDGEDLGGQTCITQGFDGGTLACNSDCQSFSTTNCTGTGPSCGNGVKEAGEACDGEDLGFSSCETEGFPGGTLVCNSNCALDTSGCFACGNSRLDPGEPCDGTLFGGKTCETEGFPGGTLVCNSNCTLDTSGCFACGNSRLDPGEPCDGTLFGGKTCETEGFPGGTLVCNSNCALDTSGCFACGNSRLDPGEPCDGTLFGGKTCETEGFPGGTLACSNCTLDTSGCFACGNSRLDPGEPCDGALLNGKTCATFGCRSTALPACQPDCTDFDLSNCQTGHDEDGDSVDDNCDNCPTFTNDTQPNADGDQVGDACEYPDNVGLLGTIALFDPLTADNGDWTAVNGTWNWKNDGVEGSRDGIAYYLNDYSIASGNYAVDVMYDSVISIPNENNWLGAIFGYSGTGSNIQAYVCVVQQNTGRLQIWERVPGNSEWQFRAEQSISVGIGLPTWRRIRVFINGDTVRCTFLNSAGSTASVSWTKPVGTTNPFNGQAGLYLNRLTVHFTSFLVYTP